MTTAVGTFDPGEMADHIAGLIADGWSVAVELGREGFWISRAEVVRGMLAIYLREEQSADPLFLIPGSTPIYLRLARNT